jgi:hypothetical protein
MFEVKVTFEAGESIRALVSGLFQPTVMKQLEEKPSPEPQPIAPTPKPAVPKPAPAPKPASAKPIEEKPSVGSSFADMDNDAKLEAIKTEVTKQTKNRKGADVKWMLAQFDAASVSKTQPLDPKDYDAFYDAITRYGKGEALTDIFPENDLA